jgi:hypothetical protein
MTRNKQIANEVRDTILRAYQSKTETTLTYHKETLKHMLSLLDKVV